MATNSTMPTHPRSTNNRPVNQSFTRSHCTQIDAPDNENESRTFMSGKNIPYAPGSFRNGGSRSRGKADPAPTP